MIQVKQKNRVVSEKIIIFTCRSGTNLLYYRVLDYGEYIVKEVEIYTDGACRGNPGPGGYGAVLKYRQFRKEISGGFARTTNNRMEIYGAIVALEALNEPCQVVLRSDSSYLVNAVSKGWLRRWKRSN